MCEFQYEWGMNAMNYETILQTCAVLAAIGVFGAPYWGAVSNYVASLAKSSGISKRTMARSVVVCLLAVAFGGSIVSAASVVGDKIAHVQSMGGIFRWIAGLALIASSVYAYLRFLREKPQADLQYIANTSAKNQASINLASVATGMLLLSSAPSVSIPTIPWKLPVPVIVSPATAAVYVYEKNDGPIPPGVASGIDKLNREKSVIASLFEDDTVDGDGDVPDQYKPALEAAKQSSIPSLVVLSGTSVVRVVKSPKTEEEVTGAVK